MLAHRWATLAAQLNGHIAAVILVRHFESEFNQLEALRHSGDPRISDPEFRKRLNTGALLTPEGIRQGRIVREFLLSRLSFMFPAAHLRRSPYPRAVQSADLILPGGEWIDDDDLRERDWGSLNGLTWRELREQHPEYFQVVLKDPLGAVVPGAEHFLEVKARARRAFHRVRAQTGKTAVLVSHGDLLKSLRHEVEGLTEAEYLSMFHAADASDQIHNGQLIVYSCINPETGEMASQFRWVVSVCPWREIPERLEWREMKRE